MKLEISTELTLLIPDRSITRINHSLTVLHGRNSIIWNEAPGWINGLVIRSNTFLKDIILRDCNHQPATKWSMVPSGPLHFYLPCKLMPHLNPNFPMYIEFTAEEHNEPIEVEFGAIIIDDSEMYNDRV